MSSATPPLLTDPVEQCAHRSGGFGLHVGQHVRVDLHRRRDFLVPETFAHDVHGCPRLQQQRRARVPHPMKLDPLHARRLDQRRVFPLPQVIHLQRLAERGALRHVRPFLREREAVIVIRRPIRLCVEPENEPEPRTRDLQLTFSVVLNRDLDRARVSTQFYTTSGHLCAATTTDSVSVTAGTPVTLKASSVYLWLPGSLSPECGLPVQTTRIVAHLFQDNGPAVGDLLTQEFSTAYTFTNP